MKKNRLYWLWIAVLIALLLLGAALIGMGLQDYQIRLRPPRGVDSACLPLTFTL